MNDSPPSPPRSEQTEAAQITRPEVPQPETRAARTQTQNVWFQSCPVVARVPGLEDNQAGKSHGKGRGGRVACNVGHVKGGLNGLVRSSELWVNASHHRIIAAFYFGNRLGKVQWTWGWGGARSGSEEVSQGRATAPLSTRVGPL